MRKMVTQIEITQYNEGHSCRTGLKSFLPVSYLNNTETRPIKTESLWRVYQHVIGSQFNSNPYYETTLGVSTTMSDV